MLKTEKKAKSAKSRAKAKAKPPRKISLTAETSRLSTAAAKGSLEAQLRLDLNPFKGAMSRLEARISTDLYKAMERAAELRGLTMTAYVSAVMSEDARRTMEENFIIRLSQADQIAFAKALTDPPAPNAKLLAAKRRHATLIRQ